MTDETTPHGLPTPDGAAGLIETDYEIGQDNVEGSFGPFGFDVHNPVFLVSGLSVVAFVFYALALPEQAESFFGWLRPALTSSFDWFFLLSANFFVLFCLILIVSPWGSVRLGGDDAEPDYTYIGWFAMLFAAGMGIGLMFFGVLEPVYHMAISEPLGVPSPFAEDGSIIPENVEAARRDGPRRDHIPLGAAPLGDLCGGGAEPGALQLQQGVAPDDPVGLLPDLRRADLGLDRSRHRHPRGLRDALRPGHVAGFRRGAGQCRARICLWLAEQS